MKHIVCVIDGTWQTPTSRKASENFSNAYALNWMLDTRTDAGEDQVVLYFSGLGSDRRSQPYTEGAFARGLDHQIAEAYINIASNYRANPLGGAADKIYIFGFSRGAVAARAIAGMIAQCGLLRPTRMNHYQDIWEHFTKGTPLSQSIQKFCHSSVPIEFVGVFDTVFGDYRMAAKFNDLTFPNLMLPSLIKVGVHILAIDERRLFFTPMLWSGKTQDSQALEQIWMPGVHSDIGGVYGANYFGIIALRTMIDRVTAHTDLRFVKVLVDHLDSTMLSENALPQINNELVFPWCFLPKVQRRHTQAATHQYLHPIVTEVSGFQMQIRKTARARYSTGNFATGDTVPVFTEWHSVERWV